MILRKKNPSLQSRLILNKLRSYSQIGVASLIGFSILCAGVAIAYIGRSVSIARGADEFQAMQPQSAIVLVTDAPHAVELISVKPDIVPGESTLQRENREKAEAEAKAKAEAEAQAKAKQIQLASASTAKKVVYTDPGDFEAVYQAAGSMFGVDPILLHAIHYVETGCSGSTSRSNPSGATGPMQFLPSTFRRHAVDGNGDGILDVHNLEDAVFSAAAYLRACGYPNVQKALYGYNPSYSYYLKVMNVARSFGYQG